MSTQANFPSHLVDPSQKGKEWISQFVKAIWSSHESGNAGNIFYNARHKYEQEKLYANGNQPIDAYKPMMGVDENDDQSFLNIDWSIIPIVPKFRRIALNSLNKVDYNIVATPIDGLANDENEDFFAEVKAKIIMREQAAQIDPEFLNLPALQLNPGEAKDLEELEMQMNYTHKHQMAIEAEQGIRLVFHQNNMQSLRDKVKADLFDHGVGGYRIYIDSNGAIKVRYVNPRNVIAGPFSKNDVQDAPFIGEVVEMSVADLKQAAGSQFSSAEYEDIALKMRGHWGNPSALPETTSTYNKGYDKFVCRVLDVEFYSVNEMVFESRVDRRGNKIYARAKFEDRNKRKEKFERCAYKVIYKAKWVIGTNYMFDYGLATDMKRAKSSLMDTSYSYRFWIPELWDGKAYGIMEQVIPIADAIQIAWYKLQNAINSARPKGIMIELGGMEDIPLGKGGKKLHPLKVLDLYNKTGTLVYRKVDQNGRQTNFKPIEELENGLGKDVLNYWQIIQNNIQLIRDITGMNELMDGSTPDPRTLTTVAKLAMEGTNNSLFGIITADRRMLEGLANDTVLYLQDIVEHSEVKGYVPALGKGTMKFFSLSKKIAMHEYGIMLEDKPTTEQRQRLIEQIKLADAQGIVDPEDVVIIENTDNLKVAQQLLAFKRKKRLKERQQEAMMQQQMNAEVQMQSAQAAEQAKQQTIQVEAQVKAMLIDKELEKEATLLQLKYELESKLEKERAKGKIKVQDVANKGKKALERIRKGDAIAEDDDPSKYLADDDDDIFDMSQDTEEPQQPMLEEEAQVSPPVF